MERRDHSITSSASAGERRAAEQRDEFASSQGWHGLSPHPVQPVSRTLSLAWKDWLVLGATLNRSDSRAAVGTR